MKLITINHQNEEHLCILANDDKAYPFANIDPRLPNDMTVFLQGGKELMNIAKHANNQLLENASACESIALADAQLLATVPRPTSCRDGYAFRQHVASARRNRKVEMIAEFDQYPIFYFTNHNAIQGPGDIWCMPDHFQKLDF